MIVSFLQPTSSTLQGMDQSKSMQPNTMPYGIGKALAFHVQHTHSQKPRIYSEILAKSSSLIQIKCVVLSSRFEQVEPVRRAIANKCADVATVTSASESGDHSAWSDVHAAQHSARLRATSASRLLLRRKRARWFLLPSTHDDGQPARKFGRAQED